MSQVGREDRLIRLVDGDGSYKFHGRGKKWTDDDISNVIQQSEILTCPLKRINLAGNWLSRIPEWIYYYGPSLQDLDISNNRIPDLPDFCGSNLPILLRLKIQGNMIKIISDGIGELEKLEFLEIGSDLVGNRVRTLPESIGNLSQLKYLDVSRNCLTGLPLSIGGMTKLKVLKASHNVIDAIPDSIGLLKSLNTFRIDGNSLESVPCSLALIVGLEILDLSDNQIEALPYELNQLSNCHILIAGNPCIDPQKPCPFLPTILNFPSLLELSARRVSIKPHLSWIPTTLLCYFSNPMGKCSECPGRFLAPVGLLMREGKMKGHGRVVQSVKICSLECMSRVKVLNMNGYIMLDQSQLCDI